MYRIRLDAAVVLAAALAPFAHAQGACGGCEATKYGQVTLTACFTGIWVPGVDVPGSCTVDEP